MKRALMAGMVFGVIAAMSPVALVEVAAQSGQARYELTATGNEARYRVREQLAGFNFPNDAVGVTKAVTGAIVLDATGKVIPDQSRFTIDATTLATDETRRDGYVQRNVLETEKFPKIELAVKELRNLPNPAPTTGSFTFQLVTDLTIRGVTKPVIWDVKAQAKDNWLSGHAGTQITFAEFTIAKPSVARVLSVDDVIRLEYDFSLIKK